MWQSKPGWCQPWTVLSTGVVLTLVSNRVSHWLAGITGWGALGYAWVPVALGVIVWWYLFLVLLPAAVREDYAEQYARWVAMQRQETPESGDVN
ncbi:hypothetical protein HOP50_03g20960 [Chloropicon primus]|nr:hypothetical protein HOP50_03g20960 [Chloropicon primus]